MGFRPNGQVFTANSDGTVRLWNHPHRLSTRTRLAEFTPPNSDGILSATGEKVCEPLEHAVDGERDAIRSVAFCPKGRHLRTCSAKARGL